LVDELDVPLKFIFLAMLVAGVLVFLIQMLAYALRELS
jgi:hypothetical protein